MAMPAYGVLLIEEVGEVECYYCAANVRVGELSLIGLQNFCQWAVGLLLWQLAADVELSQWSMSMRAT